MLFSVIAGGTVLLWLTEPFHGISSSTVGFIPVALLLATQVMTADDLRGLQWHVLWLVAGGIALGAGVGRDRARHLGARPRRLERVPRVPPDRHRWSPPRCCSRP
jgi:hypothetical protein